MENIKTYAIGSGEITLTETDAEELRRLLQFDYIESCVNRIIDNEPDAFRFTSDHNRPKFARKIADMHDDMVDMYGSYSECLEETVFHVAKYSGVLNHEYSAPEDGFDINPEEFWKE